MTSGLVSRVWRIYLSPGLKWLLEGLEIWSRDPYRGLWGWQAWLCHFEHHPRASSRSNRSYLKVKFLNFGISCTIVTSTRARDMILGSIKGFFRSASLIVSFSISTEVIFKVNRSLFKVKFLNYANFCPFLCLISGEESIDWHEIWTQTFCH